MNRIYLVRHGESEGNINRDLYREKGDHEIDLTPLGRQQAWGAGEFLRAHFAKLNECERGRGNYPMHQARLWVSPYTRARQTADEIERAFGGRYVDPDQPQQLSQDSPVREVNAKTYLIDRREHPLLCEQQFGLLNGIANTSVMDTYPDVHEEYQRAGKFWARPPGGESRFDVSVRVHQAFGTFHRDADRHGVQNIIVVCHGTTLRCFVMMWLHKPVEWLSEEPNPKNGAVRLIEDHEDKGYIYNGGS